MRYEFSTRFERDIKGLPSVYRGSLLKIVEAVGKAKNIQDILCKKIAGTHSSYRIRMGDYRVTFIIKVIGSGTIVFQRVLSRGECYDKKYIQNLLEQEKRQG